MDLGDFIEKLQKKPQSIRVKIMWLGVVVGTTIFFVLWLWSLKTNVVSLSEKNKESSSVFSENWQKVKEDIPTLWQSLGAGIGNVFDSLVNEENIEQSPTQSSYQPESKLPLESEE